MVAKHELGVLRHSWPCLTMFQKSWFVIFKNLGVNKKSWCVIRNLGFRLRGVLSRHILWLAAASFCWLHWSVLSLVRCARAVNARTHAARPRAPSLEPLVASTGCLSPWPGRDSNPTDRLSLPALYPLGPGRYATPPGSAHWPGH